MEKILPPIPWLWIGCVPWSLGWERLFPGGNHHPPIAASPQSELRGRRRRQPIHYVSGLLSEPASVSGCRDQPWSCAPLMCSCSAPQHTSSAFDITVCTAWPFKERSKVVFIIPHFNENNEIIQYFKYWKGFRPIYAFILDFLTCDSSRRKVKKKQNQTILEGTYFPSRSLVII